LISAVRHVADLVRYYELAIRLSLTPSASAVAAGLNDDIGDQQQIDDVKCVIGKSYNKYATTWCRHNKFLMNDWNLSATCEVNNKWLERLCVIEFFDLLNGHITTLS
jgi:hypothetical protein